MPRTKISEYSTTNSDNTDIESININEGCAPSGINNAIRELMVHLKEFQTGASSDPLTVAGTFVASGGATIAASAGTSASPSIHFSGDTNTGIFSPAADTIAFAEGGVETMRITSAGEVLVSGTTAIGATSGHVTIEGITGGNINLYRNDTTVTTNNVIGNVSFYGNDTTSNTPTQLAAVQARASGDHAAGDNPTDLVFYTTPDGSATVTEVVRFNQAGNVGIGTNSPSYKLTLSGTGAQTISLNSTDTGTGALGLIQLSDDLSLYRGSEGGSGISRSILLDAAATNGTVKFNTAGSERMRITSAGEVLVGGTTSIRAGTGTLTIERTGGTSTDFVQLNLYKNDTSVASGSIAGEIGFYGNDTTSNTPTQHAYIIAEASGTHAPGDNPTDLVFGTTPDGSETVTEAMRIDSAGNLEFNSGYGSVATAYGCRAWVNFNGAANTNLSGTYSQSGTTVTVTATAHGLIAGNVVYSDITSGTGVDGTYTVATVTSSSVFTYTAGTSLTTSGNITLRRSTIRASGNVSSVADNSTGDYTINFSVAMPDENYSLVGACGAQSVSTGAGNYSLGIPGISSFFTANGVKIQTWSTSNTQTDCFFINAAIFR
jgi:hypothetical protein